MTSSASEAALLDFLTGDDGDVFATINAELPGTMLPGSVTVARAPKGSAPRVTNPLPVTVEILQRGDPKATAVGIGVEEVVYTVDLQCCVRQKDLPAGVEQLQLVRDMAAALVRRYQRVSNLAPLYVRQGTVTFLGSSLTGYILTVTASGLAYNILLDTLPFGSLSLVDAINNRAGLKDQVTASVVGASPVCTITPTPTGGCTSLVLSLVAGGTPDQASIENNVGNRLVLAMAGRTDIDTDPDVSERIRAVTRVQFTFLEASAENA